MKYASLLCILCLFFLANTCKKATMETQLLQKVWLHSYEEDEGDVLAFRPNTYDFPPSRGRTGFTLEKGGIIRQYEIAPTDGLEELTGYWEFANKNNILVKLNDSTDLEQNYQFEIISLKDEVLKVKRLPLSERDQ